MIRLGKWHQLALTLAVVVHTALLVSCASIPRFEDVDGRSVLFNDEVDAVVLGRETGTQMETAFQEDLQNADEITREKWSKRPLDQKIKQTFSRVWTYWM